MHPHKFIYLTLLVLICFNCSNETINQEATDVLDPSIYFEELNISYGTDTNQKFDLYLPAGRNSSTKVMILVHGGGWSSGDKSEMNPIKNLIRSDFPNLAIANINYRLADENNKPYPMQIEDITSIINYLKDNKTEYTISEESIPPNGSLSLEPSYSWTHTVIGFPPAV